MDVCNPASSAPPRRLQSGHSVTSFEGAARERFYDQWKGYQMLPVRVQPGGMVLPKPFVSLHDSIWNFEFRADDVVVMTYPKCGTTWIQEVVWTMKNNPNLDNPSSTVPISFRSPYLEVDVFNSTDKESVANSCESVLARLLAIAVGFILHNCTYAVRLQMYMIRYSPWLSSHLLRFAMKWCPSVINISLSAMMKSFPDDLHVLIDSAIRLCRSDNPIPGLNLRMCENLPDPRTLKTHLCFSLLPKNVLEKSKVIFVMRNPKDMLVSYYHHCRLLKIHGYTGSFEEFVQTFLDGDMLYGHYHVILKEAFARQDNPNLLIVRYEDLKAAPIDQIKRINHFLGSSLTDEQIAKVAEYTSFPEMKKRDNMAGPSVEQDGELFDSTMAKSEGGFFRKGEAGAWKEVFSPELSARLDAWVSEKFTPNGIDFRFTV